MGSPKISPHRAPTSLKPSLFWVLQLAQWVYESCVKKGRRQLFVADSEDWDQVQSEVDENPSRFSAGIVFSSSGSKVFSKPQCVRVGSKRSASLHVSGLAARQLTRVSIIPAFGSLVWYIAGNHCGFRTNFRAKARILSGRHPTGITSAAEVTSLTLCTLKLFTLFKVFK